jgi:hypothetical protein
MAPTHSKVPNGFGAHTTLAVATTQATTVTTCTTNITTAPNPSFLLEKLFTTIDAAYGADAVAPPSNGASQVAPTSVPWIEAATLRAGPVRLHKQTSRLFPTLSDDDDIDYDAIASEPGSTDGVSLDEEYFQLVVGEEARSMHSEHPFSPINSMLNIVEADVEVHPSLGPTTPTISGCGIIAPVAASIPTTILADTLAPFRSSFRSFQQVRLLIVHLCLPFVSEICTQGLLLGVVHVAALKPANACGKCMR